MKVAILGVGAVGETCAHALVAGDIANTLVLLNRTPQTAFAIERDLRQARAWRGNLVTQSGSLENLDPVLGCDLVVLTVGSRLEGAQDRSAVAAKSAQGLLDSCIVRELKRLGPRLPPVLVVTNPVEPIVTWLWRQTSIDPKKLFGLGTTVDAARFSMHVGNRVDVSARSAWTDLIGEHGQGILVAGNGALSGVLQDSELAAHEKSALLLTKRDARIIRTLTERVALERASSLLARLEGIVGNRFDDAKRPEMLTALARELAPPATRFAIAAAVTEVARAIHADERRLMTVSSRPPESWTFPEVALALPFKLGQGTLGECLLASAPAGLDVVAGRIDAVVASLPA